MRRLLLAIVLCACQRELRAEDPGRWVELQSEHFTLRTDLSAPDARQAIADLELLRNALLAAGWHGDVSLAPRLEVIALATESELREFLRPGIDGYATSGVFGETLFVLSAREPILENEVAKHELTHALLASLLVTEPKWVQEGIATVLETLEIDARALVATRGALALERRAPLRAQWDWHRDVLDRAAGDDPDGFAFETRAAALVQWMADRAPEQFADLLARLSRGESSRAALDAAFPQLDASLRGVARDALSGEGARKSFPIDAWQGAIALRRLSPAEAFATRAELFDSTPACPDADAREEIELQRALALDPGNTVAVALDRRDPAPAIAAHPGDWRAWLAFHGAHRDDESSIRKAAQLSPSNATVLSALALFEQRAGHPDAARAAAERAARISPRSRIFDTLSRVYEAQHDCPGALRAFARAAGGAASSTSAGLRAYLRGRAASLADTCALDRTTLR